jgi:hypothetical protein
MSFIENSKNGVVYMTSPVIKTRHAFTTRIGGVSRGVLASLNLGENRGDAPENVAENYRLLGASVGLDTAHMAFTRQVHGTQVRVVTSRDEHTLFGGVPYDADGIVTNEPGLALICFTADCVPVLLCDEENGVIAAVHCGWRSSVGDILGNAVEKMCALGAAADSISAAIGPSIGYCCFQVGAEVVDTADKLLHGDMAGLCLPDAAPGKYRLDLRGVNRRRLLQLGLREENIEVSDECTVCCHEKYWSHRYTAGQRGSQGALIVL